MEKIRISHICKRMNQAEKPILSDISLEVHQGEFVSIMGPSGSGKSTLLGIMAGIDNASEGAVYINGIDITKLSETQLCKFRNENMGLVMQSPNLVETLTTIENIEMPLVFSKKKNTCNQSMKLLELVGLAGKEKCYSKQLSGGEAQRVAIARALACSPDILFADEPTGALDSANGRLVLDIMKKIAKENNVTIVMVTHDKELAKETDRIIYIKDGKVCHE